MGRTYIDGPLGAPLRLPSLLLLVFGQEVLYAVAGFVQSPSPFGNAITIQVLRVHAIKDIVRNVGDDGVDFQPVVYTLVLCFVELAYLLLLYALDLFCGLAVAFETAPLDIIEQLMLELRMILVVHGQSSDVLEFGVFSRRRDCTFEVVGLGL